MAVLVEGISVIVRRTAIASKCSGGWPTFVEAVRNRTLCNDAHLARVGFMHPDAVGSFIQRLTQAGLSFDDDPRNVDIVVVDQLFGPTRQCEWIEVGNVTLGGNKVAAARLKGDSDPRLWCPEGWMYEKSLSRSTGFVPTAGDGVALELVKSENGREVYRDRQTGQLFYSAGRKKK